jgi:uncharacterized protein (TIGR00730 family)
VVRGIRLGARRSDVTRGERALCDTEDVRLVCVYCGSSSGNRPEFADEARALGQAIAAADFGLVYGGGRVGLMGVVADAVLDAGGFVHGVIPESLVRAETAHTGLSVLEVVDSMHQRKARMAELACGFVVLPGGFGTFDETFEILTWNQLGLVRKPLVFLDGTGFYGPLLSALDAVVDSGFVSDAFRRIAAVVRTPGEAVATASGPAPEVPGKLDSLDVTAKRASL